MKRRLLLCLPFLLSATWLPAQTVYTLDSLRALALANNKTLAVSRAGIQKSKADRQAAGTNYLPKVALVAGYMRTGEEISLLSNDQKNSLSNIGTRVAGQLGATAGQIIEKFPDLAPLVGQISGALPQVAGGLNAAGQGVADAFRTDTRNMTAGAIMLTQPLYTGGKIRAYDRITRYSEELAGQQLRADEQQVILDVDQAYWQVVSLAGKRKLAQSYRDMLRHLDNDVIKMIREGVATKSDELTVSVKLNEAEMTLMKVEDGLSLSRMLLCQLCGLPVGTELLAADEQREDLPTQTDSVSADASTAFDNRPELHQLQTAMNIYDEKIKIERSAFLPQLALTGGYMTSNPSVFNGFEKKFNGTWNIGVTLKVPVWNWGEGKYKVRAAKAEALIARYRSEEAREKIELQVRQSAFRANEANRKLALSLKHLEKAEENLRVAGLGFREGVINTSDVLAAQTAWLQAHSDKIDAQIDVRLTRLLLSKALGTLGRQTRFP